MQRCVAQRAPRLLVKYIWQIIMVLMMMMIIIMVLVLMMMMMILANIEVRRKCELGGETSPISFPSLWSLTRWNHHHQQARAGLRMDGQDDIVLTG